MNLTTACTVRSLKRAGNGMRVATVELPDGTFGEAPAGDGLKKDDRAVMSVTLGVQSGRLYPRWLRVEKGLTMGCYQSDVYVSVVDEFGNVVDSELVFTGCHQSHVDTVSEAASLSGFLDVAKSNCVSTQYEEGGTFRFYCVDHQGSVFDTYAFHLADGVPAEYAGTLVASIAGGSNEFGSLPNYPQVKGEDMLCVTTGEGGSLVIQDPQPADISECGMVVLSGSEAMGNPFALSAEDGAAISAAIITVWAAAFVVRVVIQLVKGSSNEEATA